jgi:hypothetical protein
MKLLAELVLTLVMMTGCGVYTFSGSSIPSHLKTIDIPLLDNQSMEPDIADEITQELNKQILEDNLLRIVSEEGDATVSGSITGYTHEPYSFGAAATRQVDVEQYRVKIVADIEFLDNINSEALFKGSITGEGIYDFQQETEAVGREKAIKDLVQRILQSSLQSW